MKVFIKNEYRTVMMPEEVRHKEFGIGKVTGVIDVDSVKNVVTKVVVDFKNDICRELLMSELEIIK